jgi:hypothetical protein
MKTYFNVSDAGLIKTWISAVVLFVILNLAFAIFSPVMNQVFSSLVDQYAYNNAQLLSAKHLVLLFFNAFPYFMSMVILIFAVLS